MTKHRIAPGFNPGYDWNGVVILGTGPGSAATTARVSHGTFALDPKTEGDKQIPFAFGQVDAIGSVRYAYFHPGSDTLALVRVLALGERSATALGAESAGRIDSLLSISTDQGGDYSSQFSHTFYPGTLTQGIDPTLAGLDGTWNETLVLTDPITAERRALCYVVETYSSYTRQWAKNGGVPKWRYRIKGSRLYDHRTGVTAYTENLFLQFRYWLMDPDGRYMPPSLISQASFDTAADVGDQALSTVKRYATHILTETGSSDDWLKMFLLLGDAFWFEKEGIWNVLVDRPTSPIAVYSDLNYTTPREIEAGPADDNQTVPNKVTIEYSDVSGGVFAPWITAPVSLSTAALLAGTEIENEARYQMPQIHDRAMAETKLPYLLYDGQDDFQIPLNWRANTGDRALGDVVTQSIPERGLSDNFRLMARAPRQDGTYDVILKLMSARKYADTSTAAPTIVGSTLPNFTAAPPDIDVATITFTEDPLKPQIGQSFTIGRLAWTNPSVTVYPWLGAIEISVSINGREFRSLTADGTTPFEVTNLLELGTYVFKLIVRSLSGARSAGVTKSFNVVGKTTPPSDVLVISASQREAKVYVSWPAVPDTDIASYELRRVTAGGVWADAIRVTTIPGTEFWDEPPIGTWTYLVKAIDTAKHYSTNAASTSVTVFYYGTEGVAGEATLDGGDLTTFGGVFVGDTRTFFGGLILIEGASVKNFLTFMLTRSEIVSIAGGTPANCDSEIAAAGYASIQAWETAKDAPRRNGQGIWAPLPMPLPSITGEFFGLASSHSFNGDALGWRNYDLKHRIQNVKRIGIDAVDVIAKAEAIAAVFVPGAALEVFCPSPARVAQAGGRVKFMIGLATNNAFSQVIAQPPYSAVIAYSKQQTYPRIMPPTDFVSDGSGNVTFTYPTAMLNPNAVDQVPHLDVQVLGNASASWAVTAISRTGATVKVFNPATGAALVGQSVRISAEDRGGGGALTTT